MDLSGEFRWLKVLSLGLMRRVLYMHVYKGVKLYPF